MLTGDRFSSQSLADCAYCPPGGRQFRTARQCAGCGRPLCLVCRPWVPRAPHLCPECGGGPLVNALQSPEAAAAGLQAAGQEVPYWLAVIRERAAARASIEDEIVPE